MWFNSSKKFSGNMIVSIVTDQWICFISRYELTKVEIVKYKAGGVANKK